MKRSWIDEAKPPAKQKKGNRNSVSECDAMQCTSNPSIHPEMGTNIETRQLFLVLLISAGNRLPRERARLGASCRSPSLHKTLCPPLRATNIHLHASPQNQSMTNLCMLPGPRRLSRPATRGNTRGARIPPPFGPPFSFSCPFPLSRPSAVVPTKPSALVAGTV